MLCYEQQEEEISLLFTINVSNVIQYIDIWIYILQSFSTKCEFSQNWTEHKWPSRDNVRNP